MKNSTENRINTLFRIKKQNILSVYFTAGYPRLEDTVEIIQALENAGADMVEIGIPFSDPTADGPVIQHSNEVALKNGMTLKVLFQQLAHVRDKVKIPLLLMGYFNPVFRFGVEQFCRKCRETGIDGVILPDLPPEEFSATYKDYFKKNQLHHILLITPQTPDERIREIDRLSTGFIYMVSSASTTGSANKGSDSQSAYFEKVRQMELANPCLIGFNISDRLTFKNAGNYAAGGIIGSAFIRSFSREPVSKTIPAFIRGILNKS